MKKIFDNKQDLYMELALRYEKYLTDNYISIKNIDPKLHVLSRRQYYYLKSFSEDKKTKGISDKKLEKLLDLLSLRIETNCIYKLSDK